MSGSSRPQFVLFGSSIVQFGFYGEGWAANLAHVYARKVLFLLLILFTTYSLRLDGEIGSEELETT